LKRSVEVDVSRLLPKLGIVFRFFEKLVELPVQHLTLILFRLERFAEGIFAASGLALQFRDCGRKILYDGRFDWFFVRDYGAQIAVDPEFGLATGAEHFEKFAGHAFIIVRRRGAGCVTVPVCGRIRWRASGDYRVFRELWR
jgi:hypothetical protein